MDELIYTKIPKKTLELIYLIVAIASILIGLGLIAFSLDLPENVKPTFLFIGLSTLAIGNFLQFVLFYFYQKKDKKE